MTYLEAVQQRERFKKWKARAIKRITPLLVIFFSNPQKSEHSRLVGRIVERLHNPYYDILNCKGEHLDEQTIIANRIFLELEVEEFCKLVKI